MKKFFTFVAAALAAVTMNAENPLVKFTEAKTAVELQGYTVTDQGLTFSVPAASDKAIIEKNSCLFGTSAEDSVRFDFRIKTGGASTGKSGRVFTLAVPEDGTLKVYARTGSSAELRNLTLKAGTTEVLNVKLNDNDTVVGRVNGKKCFKPLTVKVNKGVTYSIEYTDNGINIYGFELVPGEGGDVKPETGKVFDFTTGVLDSVAKIKALSDYTGEAAGWALVDATSSDSKPYVKWNLTTAGAEAKVAFKNFPLTVSYTNPGTKDEFVKTYGTYFQVGGKGVVLTFDVEDGESVKLYPKSYGKDCEFAVTGATVEKVAVAKESEQVLAIKAAAGSKQIVLKANGGGNSCQFYKMEIVAGEVGPLPIDTTTITLKFINTLKWADGINAYTYKGDGNPKNAEWPGIAAEKSTEQLCDFDVYKYSFKDSIYTHIIFNDGKNQTENLEILLANNNKIYDPAKKAWCTESEVKKNYIVNYYDDKNIITFDAYKETGAAVGEWSKDLEIYSVSEDYYITLVDGVSPAAYKMVVDANSCYFAKDPKSINEENLDTDAFAPAYRLKTGGKTTLSVAGDAESDLTNYIEGYCEKDMTLYIAARTGSNNATDRNIIVKQFDTELVNKVLQESDAYQYKYGSASDKTRTIYPLIELKLKEGSFEISYPVGAINIYGILSDEKGEAPEGIENTEAVVKAVKMIENGQLVIIKNGVRYTVMGQRL